MKGASSASFDIFDDPWLDVLRSDGTKATLSLRELLKTAHEIVRLSESSPLTEVALLRFLIALVSDGLRVFIPTEADWGSFARRCDDGLPAAAIDAILTPLAGRSNVLDPDHDAFFDGPAIRQGRQTGKIYPAKDEGSSPTDVLLSIPTDSEIAHFHQVHGSESICPRCLLKGVLTKSLFATGGGGGYSAGAAGAKPALMVLLGSSLLDTLLLNCLIPEVDDEPAWRRRFSESLKRLPKVLERISWRARLYAPRFDSISSLPCVGCGCDDIPTFVKLDRADGFNRTAWAEGKKASDLLGKDEANESKHVADPHLIRQKGDTSRSILSADPKRGLLAAISEINSHLEEIDPGTDQELLSQRLIPFVRTATARISTSDLRFALFASLGDPKKMNIEEVRSAEVRIKVSTTETGRIHVDIADSKRNQENEVISSTADSLKGYPALVPAAEYPKDAPLYDVAVRMIKRLDRLSTGKLAALRQPANSMAAWHAAFVKVWYRLPASPRRHALREALASVAPIFAAQSQSHRFATRG